MKHPLFIFVFATVGCRFDPSGLGYRDDDRDAATVDGSGQADASGAETDAVLPDAAGLDACTECDPIVQTCCGQDEACYADGFSSSYCAPSGTGVSGSSCTSDSDCGPGFDCGGFNCFRLCTDTSMNCPGNCVTNGATYGYCGS